MTNSADNAPTHRGIAISARAAIAAGTRGPLVAIGTWSPCARSTVWLAWCRGGRQPGPLWGRLRLAHFYIVDGIEPVAGSARRGFLFWWCGCRTARAPCAWQALPRWPLRSWRNCLRGQFLFSGLLHAFWASYFFRIGRLEPLATGRAAHFDFAHARSPL